MMQEMDRLTHDSLLMIFRAHHSTTYPVVIAGLSLTLLALCGEYLDFREKKQKRKQHFIKKRCNYVLLVCTLAALAG